MLSICCNSGVKSWRNKKRSAKLTKIKTTNITIKITKTKPFINKYNWKGINVPSEKDYLKTFEKNNVIIVLNVLYTKKQKIYPAYVTKNNLNCQKLIFF